MGNKNWKTFFSEGLGKHGKTRSRVTNGAVQDGEKC